MTQAINRIPPHEVVIDALARKDYGEYVEYSQYKYIHGKFTRYITKEVQDFIESDNGNAYDILCLSVPPQHGKSWAITETLPSWAIGKHPDWRIIIASYNDDFGKKFARRNRDKIERFGERLFGIRVDGKDTENEYEIGRIGSIMSRGLVQGGITGNPANLFIIDDPIKTRQEAESESTRGHVRDAWLDAVKTRLAPNAKIIIIQTRWHKEDLIGFIMRTEPTARLINFPVVCLDEKSDALGRKLGETLCPEIGRDNKWWDSFKVSYMTTEGSRSLNSLYYGSPTNVEGEIFKRAWLEDNFYREIPTTYYKVIGLDATFKDGDNSDYVAIQTWSKVNQDCYLHAGKIKQRMTFTQTVEAMRRVLAQHPDYDAILVEDKANGSAVIDTLRKEFMGVIAVEPYGSKVSRANAVAPVFEAGNVHVHPNDYTLVDELCDFPFSDNDDEVDTATMCIYRLKNVVAEPPTIRGYDEDEEIEYEDQAEDVLGYTG